MKKATYETHYMKNKVPLWSTSVKKEIATLPFLFISFSFVFFFPFFLWAFFLAFLLFFLFFSLGNVLIMMIITLLFITTQGLQLDTRTKYDSIWVPPVVYRDGQWIKSDMYEKLWMVALPQIRCQLRDHARQYDNDEACHNNWTVERCMAIYLEMAMEMP